MNDFPGQSLTGTDRFGRLGSDVSSAGDINGDGFDDYIVGASRQNTTQNGVSSSGAAFVVYGDENGPSTLDVDDIDGTNGFRINNNGAQGSNGQSANFSSLGQYVTGLGDVNGDGIDDLLVAGDTRTQSGGLGETDTATNYAYVLFGSTSGFAADVSVSNLDGTDGFAIDGIDGYLTRVSANDINGDGINDIIIGQNPVPEVTGGFYYVANSIEVLPPDDLGSEEPGPVIAAAAAGDTASGGFVLFGATDLGDTGTADLGALDGTNGFSIQSEVGTVRGGFEGPFIYDSRIGGGIFDVGDLNGDGFDDIFIQNVIGETNNDPEIPIGIYDGGYRTEQYILFGSDTGFAATIDPATNPDVLALDYEIANFQDTFGDQAYSIAGIGDVNGDGFDDLAVAVNGDLGPLIVDPIDVARSAAPETGGYVQVVYGSANGPATTLNRDGLETGEGFVVFNSDLAERGDGFGTSVSAAGDVNGDGIADFIVGAPGADVNEVNAGSTFLVLGNANGFADSIDLGALTSGEFSQTAYRFDGTGNSDYSGTEVSAAGDLNGDGFDDIIIAAPNADNEQLGTSGSSTGETYVIYGGPSLEAFDNVDGTDDNVIDLSNIDANISTGEIPTEISIRSQGIVSGLETDTGTTPITFTLRRDGDPSRAVSVDYAVTGSGFYAADGDDFGGILPSGTVTFEAGSLTADLVVNVSGDDEDEQNEGFRVTLSNPVGAGTAETTLGNATAFGRIDTDDVPPRIFITGGNSITEGDTGDTTAITFTINREGDASDGVTVDYDIAGAGRNALLSAGSDDVVGDLPTSGSITFAAGETSVGVTVLVTGDDDIEARESLALTITDVASGDVTYAVSPASRTATIFNDDGRPPVIPDGVESDVFGDPHLVSLDGLAYDFQAVGEYILVETLPGDADPFQVQVRFEAVNGSQVASQTTAMAVEIDGRTVEIIAGGDPALKIDGVPTTLDPETLSLDLNGDDTPDIFFDGVDYTIVLNDAGEQLKVGNFGTFLNVCVFLSDAAGGHAGAVRGLMGDGDGDFANDFALRDGTPLPTAAVTTEIDGAGNAVPRLDFDFLYGRGNYDDGTGYADSWALDGSGADKTAIFTGDAVVFPANFPAAAIDLDDLPAEIRAQAEQAALDAGLDPADVGDAIFDAAVLDFALTGNPDFLTGAAGLAASPVADSDPTNTGAPLDAIGILPSATAVTEGDGGTTTVLFTVYRTGDIADALTADYQIGGDIDADDLAADELLTGTVSFAAGSDTATVAVDIAGDIANEADETLTFSISNLSNSAVLVANDSVAVTVLNDDTNNAPVLATELEDQNSDEDTSFNFTFPADAFTDIDGDALSFTAMLADGSPLPSWVNFSDVNRTFFGTPPQDFNGTLSVEVTATDEEFSASDIFNLAINPINDTPIVANALDDVSSPEDEAVSIAIPADVFSDVDGNALSINVTLADGSALPTWLIFDPATRTIAGTPPQNFNGKINITVAVSDGQLEASDTFTLDITPVNDAPIVVEEIEDQSSDENTPFSFVLPVDTFSDADGDALSLSVTLADGSALPAWLSYDPETRTLAGTPPLDFVGTLDIAVSASDGQFTATDTFTLDILDTNNAPIVVAPIADQSSAEDAPISITLNPIFADADGDALLLSATLADGSALPEWLTFDASTRSFSGTPPQDFVGMFDITVSASDGAFVASDTFTLDITPVNDTPIVANALKDQTFDEDAPVGFTLATDAFSDIDGDTLTLTATLADGTALPAWLVFDADSATFSGTPPQDFNGALAIAVTASDGDLNASDTFSLTIAPVNDSPVVANPLADQSFEEDAPISFTLAADAFADPDGDALTIGATLADGAALPAWLTFDAATGTFFGTPPQDFTGTLSIAVTADDGELNVSDNFDLEITPATDDPFEGFDRGTEGRDFLFGSLFHENKIFGAGGNDYIFGGFADDILAGGKGADRLWGSFGSDTLLGNEGNDRLWGSFGNDSLFGDKGHDRLYGGSGRDTLDGGAGVDRLYGQNGNDDLRGGSGNDRLYGQKGNDVLEGGTGNDRLTGGSGADVFVFSEGDGRDRIDDFSFGYSFWGWSRPGDTIRLDVDGIDDFQDLIATGVQRGNNSIFGFGDGDRLTIRDTRLTWFNEDDFDFV